MKNRAFLVFIFCFLTVSDIETVNLCKETISVVYKKQDKYDFYYETVIHESSHYIIYDIVSRFYGYTPTPIEVSIIPTKTDAGYFKASRYGDWRVEVLTAYAGYASKVVFLNAEPKTVFYDMVKNDTPDFKMAANANINDAANIKLMYRDFLDTIQWIRKYKGNIQNFAIKLDKQKIIKF